MIVQGRFTVSVPSPNLVNGNQPIKSIRFGECLFLNFVDLNYPNGATGNDANSKAQRLADLINFLSTNVTVEAARNTQNMNATVLNNVVTVNILIDDSCCLSNGTMTNLGEFEIGEGTPQFIGRVSNIVCEPIIPPVNPECAGYPDRSHVYRFRFINDNNTLFAPSGTDFRYYVNPANTLTNNCVAISFFQILTGLSVQAYFNFADFLEGWAITLNAYWSGAYGGSVTHLGNGVMEITVLIDSWAAANLGDICAVGVGIQCGVVGEPTNSGLTVST